MEEPLRQNMRNPQTGEFEMLSHIEWLRLKVGFNKDYDISREICAIKGGSKWVVSLYFQDVCIHSRTREVFIEELYEKWWPKHPTPPQLLGWVRFIKEVYNLEDIFKAREDLIKCGKALLKNTVRSHEAKKVYNARVH